MAFAKAVFPRDITYRPRFTDFANVSEAQGLADNGNIFKPRNSSKMQCARMHSQSASPSTCSSEDSELHRCPFNLGSCPGCLVAADEARTGHLSNGSDHRSAWSYQNSTDGDPSILVLSGTPCSSIASFNSPPASRMQLKEHFLISYFPAAILGNETDSIYTKYLSRDILEERGPTSTAAIEALLLLQSGGSQSDRRLVQEARKKYRCAIADLNSKLENDEAMYSDDILAAIFILACCCPDETSGLGGRPRQAYFTALRDRLLVRGPRAEYSHFAQLIVYNMRHITASTAHANRTKACFAGREWQDCSAMTDAYMTGLSRQFLALPGLLQRADLARQRQRLSAVEISAVLAELARFERDSQNWLLSWYSSFEHSPYWKESSKQFPHFARRLAQPSDVFVKTICFSSFSHASAHVTYWMSLLQLKQTTIELNRLFSKPVLPLPNSLLISEANDYADNLCQSVAWVSQPRFGWAGLLRAREPLKYARSWYCSQNASAQVHWCRIVGESLEHATEAINCFVPCWEPDDDDCSSGVNGTAETPPS